MMMSVVKGDLRDLRSKVFAPRHVSMLHCAAFLDGIVYAHLAIQKWLS